VERPKLVTFATEARSCRAMLHVRNTAVKVPRLRTKCSSVNSKSCPWPYRRDCPNWRSVD